jgi:hypothetical protein
MCQALPTKEVCQYLFNTDTLEELVIDDKADTEKKNGTEENEKSFYTDCMTRLYTAGSMSNQSVAMIYNNGRLISPLQDVLTPPPDAQFS